MSTGVKIALGAGAVAVVASIIYFVTKGEAPTLKKKKSLGKTRKTDSNERVS